MLACLSSSISVNKFSLWASSLKALYHFARVYVEPRRAFILRTKSASQVTTVFGPIRAMSPKSLVNSLSLPRPLVNIPYCVQTSASARCPSPDTAARIHHQLDKAAIVGPGICRSRRYEITEVLTYQVKHSVKAVTGRAVKTMPRTPISRLTLDLQSGKKEVCKMEAG
jgi:hypothetical protein